MPQIGPVGRKTQGPGKVHRCHRPLPQRMRGHWQVERVRDSSGHDAPGGKPKSESRLRPLDRWFPEENPIPCPLVGSGMDRTEIIIANENYLH